MSVKVLNGARRYYVQADALADHQAGAYRIEVVEGGMYDKRVAELEAELAGAHDLIRFLAQLYCQLDHLRYETIKLPEGEIVDYMINKWPVVQGTANQIRLMRLGEMPYDSGKLAAAIDACLARHGDPS
ncbi:hypothetical protein ACVA51_13725 [Pseudomonas luteola]